MAYDTSDEAVVLLRKLMMGDSPMDSGSVSRGQTLQARAFFSFGRRRGKETSEVLFEIITVSKDDATVKLALRALGFSSSADDVVRLKVMERSAPQSLKESYRSTIELIENRREIQRIRSGL